MSARASALDHQTDPLVAMSADLIVVAGFDGSLTCANPAFVARLGYTEPQTLTRAYLEFVHPDDRERTIEAWSGLVAGETRSFENRYRCQDGSYGWVDWTAAAAVEDRLIYAVGRDVTERREAEADLREAEKHSRGLAEEQAALRRVAMLVARKVPAEELFAAVVEEVGRVLHVVFATLGRYEPDGSMTLLADWSQVGDFAPPVGARRVLGGKNISTLVFETGRPVRIDNYADSSGGLGVGARDDGVGSGVGTPVIVEGRLWGVLGAYATADQVLPADTDARLQSFTELVATAIANGESRVGVARLADEQAALRRVATLVARGAPPANLFARVTEEVGQLLGVQFAGMARYESDHTVTVLATWAAGGEHPLVPGPWPLEGGDLASRVWETGRSVRIDDYRGVPGRIAAFVRDELGIGASVASPIVVEGRLWGALFVHAKQSDEPFPPHTEARLASFTELLSTAIANAESRTVLARLVEEQAALRRIATLVARSVAPEEVFAAVIEEVGRLLPVDLANLCRYDPDGLITFVATWARRGTPFPVGSRWPLGGQNLGTLVSQTGRAARIDSYAEASGPLSVTARDGGLRSAVGTPIVVEGRLWGMMGAGSSLDKPLPPDTEARLASFTELVATAIANAENRSELAASRARIVAASDEARRRIERDLHDGIQQRLVSLSLELRLAESIASVELEEARRTIRRVVGELDAVTEELRELSRGIHPAILTEGGLGPALRTLARRSAVPIAFGEVVEQRLPEQIEVAAYYVVSEALANATKHARASRVEVEAAKRQKRLALSIRDDGIGGADPARGSGLVGLRDRVEALGGTIDVESRVDGGTALLVALPLPAAG